MEQANDPGRETEQAPELGAARLDEGALDELLQRVIVLTRHTVAHADAVSITLADNGGYRTSNSSGPDALAMDEVQYGSGSGPCVEATRSARQVEVVIGVDAGQAPAFHEEAGRHGVRSVLSTPLLLSPQKAVGALNMYTRSEGGYGDDEPHVARLLGEQAAVLMMNALAIATQVQLNEQLQQALASREIIGQAKGIIMERQNCDRDEAFDILRRASQRENRKLRDLAEELVVRVESRGRDGRPA